ncbi:MAG: flagellar protein FliT [Rhodocyclaceae bacterium]|nr:flagellar protein FliT [Rhodocyclaceae bacterium]MBX3668630.1 flagellar protein FliT [Rhodocyclaceae bacterium]
MQELAFYETMSALSGQMVHAARANDWNRLVELERSVAHMRDDVDPLPPPAALADRARKVDLIRKILQDDAEIRRHTEPWLEAARRFLDRQDYARAAHRV